jgi:hypothetical protein
MGTESEVPVSGSLSARLIRACPEHKKCSLDCPKREAHDLGEIASFDSRSLIQRLKEVVPRWRR